MDLNISNGRFGEEGEGGEGGSGKQYLYREVTGQNRARILFGCFI